ncbi:laminin subunit gamma-3 isoform X1 [Oncorhynchus mykiss]|uniref:laminin subunit gamma-3 isoform X1 n=1 Tax=Oncorhynchus mykiss TaxID=8022 RepID=UPI001877CED0|nr:laminin subunit gamma-3 isoform X1 [Oncorhynchus mykiss]
MDIPLTTPLLLALLLCSLSFVHGAMDSCYDDDEGVPSRCMPKFENAAFNRTIMASNVCGSPPEDYCMQTSSTRSCHHCSVSDMGLSHNASLLTDFHTDEEPTWWQSQSMFYRVQHPNSVNLTLRLGKAFEITYVRLKFYTSRPESFAIYKRTNQDGPWVPYQYYSASCSKTYRKNAKGYIRPGDDERMALCTDEFSDISPLTGGNVAFSTLEGRPSAYNFDQSAVLQEWVTATDLLISLDRLNTFGDEFFKDAKVLRSYFYAISDFSVGARCKCNGHGSECVLDEQGALVCDCQHHTAGVDCQKCHPFYQDRPWARATGDSANQCMKCNCSGRADACVFDAEQYRSTGSGGRCVDCRDHTDGPHCERCKENHYRRSPQDLCRPCDCNTIGSVSLQCGAEGMCTCRPSVTGEKCDTCQPGFHSLSPGGCRSCDCETRGSVGICSTLDGGCHCKDNVEGQACDRCKPGSFNLQENNPAGCTSCFCFGHSLSCRSSNHHAAVNITSDFLEDPDRWSGQFSGGQEYPLLWKEGEVYLLPLSEDDLGFYRAPEKFLGNHLLSYGQLLSLTFTAEAQCLLPHSVTVLLEGSGITLSADLSPQPGLVHQPGLAPQHNFTLRLHKEETRLRPSLSAFEFQSLLFNLTAFRISNAGGHNYTSQLSGVTLASAAHFSSPVTSSTPPAPWVEVCTCPPGFGGQFCELCAPGYTREVPNRGPLSPCVPCTCHQHGPCHPETGVCECADFTTGPTCERCLDGYYGNALIGTTNDCQTCPCPDHTSCAQIMEIGDVVCTNCPSGQRGTRCELCEDGFHGDPLGRSGLVRQCERCDCNGNVDPNALGVCDHMTGRCFKCLGHTEGDHCQRCRRGYYGDAMDRTMARKCKPCDCSPAGTSGLLEDCDPQTGSCQCLSHVTGGDCGQCSVGFFNLQPGVGCERCNCNPIGSSSAGCHPITGQCVCQTGLEGRLCSTCRMGFFGFSSQGCRACNCDPMGSRSMQCHTNGTCPCRQGFVGYKCDQCELNYFHNRATHQCEECPVCYGLVKEEAGKLKARLQDLEKLLARFDCRNGSGRQHHVREYHVRQHHERGHQGEDSLPNALEDFLAIQEAKEAFVKQFALLETSTHTLSAQLHTVATALNCSASMEEEQEEGWRTLCRTLADSVSVIRSARTQLTQATLDLDNMVIPFKMTPVPNSWNSAVNESEILMKSHTEMAGHIESIATKAFMASNQTYSLLMDLLEDNSVEEYISNLTEQMADMQQMKENLTAQVNETLAIQLSLEEESGEIMVAFVNLTSSILELSKKMPNPSSGTNQSDPSLRSGANQTEGVELSNRTSELAFHVQSKEELASKIREEIEPRIQTAHNNLAAVQDMHKLTVQAQGSKVIALSSVVTGKEVESKAITLRRELEDMQREWPQRQAQTKAALKRERLLREKVLEDVSKKVNQTKRVLRPALESATLSNATAQEAKHTANALSKEAKATLTQGKHTRTLSAQLSSSVDITLQQLAEQENHTVQAQTQANAEPVESLASVKVNIQAAKLQLEAYSLTLTQLVSKIDGGMALERFERILSETAVRLSVLRGSVESPALNVKIQTLRSAAQDQNSQLTHLEQDLQEIRQERDSLKDIALHLPQTCPQASGIEGH